MSTPFRSTIGLASRRRVRPVVERATFVIISCGPVRCALPVEGVERVLRPAADSALVTWNGHTLRWADLGAAPGAPCAEPPDVTARRVLVVRDDHARTTSSGHWAVPVDAVHEVFAVEAALLQPWSAEDTLDAPALGLAVRATFERHGQRVHVIDARRSLTPRS